MWLKGDLSRKIILDPTFTLTSHYKLNKVLMILNFVFVYISGERIERQTYEIWLIFETEWLCHICINSSKLHISKWKRNYLHTCMEYSSIGKLALKLNLNIGQSLCFSLGHIFSSNLWGNSFGIHHFARGQAKS